MKFFDMHCDTLMKAFVHKNQDIYEMPGAMLDIKRMKEAGAMGQFFAIFMFAPGMDKKMGFAEPVDDEYYIETCMKIFNSTMEKCKEIIAPAFSYSDVINNEKEGKMSGILTFEDGRAVNGDMDKLKGYYEKGIRLISLTWNQENCFGFPNSTDPEIMKRGLHPFGKEAVKYMNELGIIIDVSHLSDGGFYDVAELSEKPFVASHSNCRALSPHQRNLTDDMVKVLSEKGGVTGINFAPAFLNSDIESRSSTVKLMSEHIQRLINLGGIECVALGSDLDGISGDLELSSVDKMGLLFDQLHKDKISDDAIEKIAYKNVQRVIKDTMK